MRRLTVSIAVLLLFGSLGIVTAQPAPPQPVGMNPIGQPMTIYNFQGVEIAQVTVTEVVDPFLDWADYFGPNVDERYVVLTVQIQNSGERPFEFSTFDFQLLDSLGRLHYGGWFERSPAAVVAVPDLEDMAMLPGEAVTGALSFNVPADAQLTQLVYMFYGDEGQQLYLVADLSGAAQATPGP